MQPNADLIPPDTKDTIDLYVSHGYEPGSFVSAVLEGDLFGAVQRADAINLANLIHTCAYVYNCIPTVAWGSPEAVKSWKKEKREKK